MQVTYLECDGCGERVGPGILGEIPGGWAKFDVRGGKLYELCARCVAPLVAKVADAVRRRKEK